MSIRGYLLIIIIIPLCQAIIFGQLFSREFTKMSEMRKIANTIKSQETGVTIVKDAIQQYFVSSDLLITTGDTYLIQGSMKQGDNINKKLSALVEKSGDTPHHKNISEIARLFERFHTSLREISEKIKENPDQIKSISLTQLDNLSAQIVERSESTLSKISLLIRDQNKKIDTHRKHIDQLNIYLPLTYLMTLIILGAWAYRSLSNPIQRLYQKTTTFEDKKIDNLNHGPKEIQALSKAFHDLTSRLFYQANHDSLTGLYNRMAFNRILKELFENSRDSDVTHTLCFIDLDHFKVINDTCGHAAGDELLKQIASMMTSTIRNNDVVARLGGDEFTILFRECNAQKARYLTENVRQKIKDYDFFWGNEKLHVSSSFGISEFCPKTTDISSTFNLADLACMHAKKTGRNCVIELQERVPLQAHSEQKLSLNDIHDALENDHFVLYHQEIIRASDEKHIFGSHFEILLRMKNKKNDGIDLNPSAFMPVVERFGLFPELDRWVVRSTIDWLLSHPSRLANTELCSINLSGNSICNSEMLKFIEIELGRLEGKGHKLCFEITETEAINDFQYATLLINQLKSFGCKVALDDFGSGLSSFSYLKNLDIDFVKIDGCFVRDMLSEPSDRATVQAILDVARAFNKRTVAEWVENEALAETLIEMGVDYLQGYYFDHPKPVDGLPRAIENILKFRR